MPIKEVIKHDFYTKIVVWQLTESAQELFSFLSLNEEEIAYYKKLPPKICITTLGVRCCLKTLSKGFKIIYNEKGKPFLENGPFISISHSHGMVCLVISKKPIGIDIELNRPEKIENIQSKFIREDEMIWLEKKTNNTDFLHIIWGIKESLYKLEGGNFYNFLYHYKVTEFDVIENKSIECSIIENENIQYYYAFYQKIEDYFLVWVVEKN